MRQDMDKVLIERPRYKGWSVKGYNKPGPLEDLPTKEKMRSVRTKDLNDFLSPLRRFLVGSVGRPWRDVESEVRRRLSPKSYMQKHVLDHFYSFVDTDSCRPEWNKGALFVDDEGILRRRQGYNERLTKPYRRVKKEPLKLNEGNVVEFKGVLYVTEKPVNFDGMYLYQVELVDSRGIFVLDKVADTILAKKIQKSLRKTVGKGRVPKFIDFKVSWWNLLAKKPISTEERKALNI